MNKQIYITEEERENAKRLPMPFWKSIRKMMCWWWTPEGFGFVKLQNYMLNEGFDSVTTYTDSRDMLEDLWQEWLITQLFALSKGTPMEDFTQEELLKILPTKKQKEFAYKKICFMNKAAI